ncbi:MAG: hypothetical protein CVV41_08860 [Candidatus Riflebacteria bacterium HGW-Riflebacteria-1]|nr:MAG: hypothetical protein CVV41_08860 [Candidatus Riflebacteria bacterium HGW-Riflebacteria-1]
MSFGLLNGLRRSLDYSMQSLKIIVVNGINIFFQLITTDHFISLKNMNTRNYIESGGTMRATRLLMRYKR